MVEHFIARTREIYRMEVRTQSAGQGLGGLWIAFQYNNTRTHKSPELSTVVNGRLRLQGRAGKTTTPQTSQSVSPGETADALSACWRLFCHRLKRCRLEPRIFLQQDPDFTFGLFQLLAAGRRELHPLSEDCEGFIEGHFPLLQFL